MERYTAFSYEDNLQKRYLERLPDSLKIRGERDSDTLLILRILSGNAKVIHNYTNSEIKSRVNYFSSDFEKFGNWKNELPILISEDIKSDDLSKYIESTKYLNRKFYSSILSELSQFLYHENKGSHTTAFLFIYRILEKISYAFPLIYTSKAQDFHRSFESLKKMMKGDDSKGELGFFKTFVSTLYDGDSISETSIDISFQISDEVVKKRCLRK